MFYCKKQVNTREDSNARAGVAILIPDKVNFRSKNVACCLCNKLLKGCKNFC